MMTRWLEVDAHRRSLIYDDARVFIQVSDAKLDKGLRDRRVLIFKGELRPIAPSHLTTILELLLTNLVSLSLSHTAAPISTLVSAFEDDHDIRRDIARQVTNRPHALADPPTPQPAPHVRPRVRAAKRRRGMLCRSSSRSRGGAGRRTVAPFFADISIDAKERDKLLLKYARALTDSDGVWYRYQARKVR
ncbi:hypothetical protein V8D89_003071 [Ganoderma adspersum]